MPTSNQSCYMKYTTVGDRRVCNNLLKAILDSGYVVSVCDGEEWTLKQSDSLTAIKDALGSTGDDTLRVRKCKGGDVVGSFWLIWDNGDDYPISDYTANDECDRLCKLSGQDD